MYLHTFVLILFSFSPLVSLLSMALKTITILGSCATSFKQPLLSVDVSVRLSGHNFDAKYLGKWAI